MRTRMTRPELADVERVLRIKTFIRDAGDGRTKN